jgi:hypothetical protein
VEQSLAVRHHARPTQYRVVDAKEMGVNLVSGFLLLSLPPRGMTTKTCKRFNQLLAQDTS